MNDVAIEVDVASYPHIITIITIINANTVKMMLLVMVVVVIVVVLVVIGQSQCKHVINVHVVHILAH